MFLLQVLRDVKGEKNFTLKYTPSPLLIMDLFD
jgi:hypothetical protein